MVDDSVPAELTLLRDFANSLDVEEGTDELTTPAGLVSWLAPRELISASEEASADDLAFARRLRDSLRVAVAAHHGARMSGAAAAELDEVASALSLRVSFSGGEPQLVPVEDGVRGALARLLADVVVAQRAGTWERLKICPAADCAWVFYDRSKNRSRRWCSMGVCGNRTKTRAYRARRRA